MSLIVDVIAICFWPLVAVLAVHALERGGVRIDLDRMRIRRET